MSCCAQTSLFDERINLTSIIKVSRVTKVAGGLNRFAIHACLLTCLFLPNNMCACAYVIVYGWLHGKSMCVGVCV